MSRDEAEQLLLQETHKRIQVDKENAELKGQIISIKNEYHDYKA